MVITRALPTKDSILELEPEELADFVLNHFPPNTEQVNPMNFLGEVMNHYKKDGQVEKALVEAWAWLVSEGLLIEKPGGYGAGFISRRGQRLREQPQEFETFRRSNVLPKKSLHPTIAARVWSSFIRGDYDTAVFQAFKEVEVAVRAAGGFAATDIGTELMGKAFNFKSGPLTDKTLPEAERRSMLQLFAGAVGLFKNPSSHRHVVLDNPMEAAEMIAFASLLMRIVDTRAAARRAKKI